jgi:CheY-like chemotaxis protein
MNPVKRAPTKISSDIPSPTLPNQSDRVVEVKPTVLIAQNDLYVSAILWTLLNRRGFQAISETSGPAARELARTLSPDAVVLDVNLPEMNGLEICRQLKADPGTRMIPVIFCCGQRYLAEEALELGAAGFLAMPGEIFKLPHTLRRTLSARTHAIS